MNSTWDGGDRCQQMYHIPSVGIACTAAGGGGHWKEICPVWAQRMAAWAEAATGPAHTNTMTFDMTDKDGIDAFEYARLGGASHSALWTLWDEMCKASWDHECGGKPDQFITHQWLQRLLEIMDDHGVPLEV